jgi:DMSO/TMAO reductase YedYZ heme-binding membrane subunit
MLVCVCVHMCNVICFLFFLFAFCAMWRGLTAFFLTLMYKTQCDTGRGVHKALLLLFCVSSVCECTTAFLFLVCFGIPKKQISKINKQINTRSSTRSRDRFPLQLAGRLAKKKTRRESCGVHILIRPR